jgi:dethiobiotin synthetase
MNYFVTAIGTDSGKTIVSAILCEALGADYWKPVQAGWPTDAERIKELVKRQHIVIHRERYLLKLPASPHAAAAAENIEINLNDFSPPKTKNDLIIEGAGGALVPLNSSDFVIDLAKEFNSRVILVSNNYLGSINHTLLTWEALKSRGLEIVGIIFNGDRNSATEEIILHHTGLRCLLKLEPENEITKDVIGKYARILKENWKKLT